MRVNDFADIFKKERKNVSINLYLIVNLTEFSYIYVYLYIILYFREVKLTFVKKCYSYLSSKLAL